MDVDKKRILLVEDNPSDFLLMQEILRINAPDRYDLQFAEKLKTGLKRLAEEHFDALLLDLSLPDSSGLDTVQRARAAVPDMPMIVLTGHEDEQLAIQAVQAGAQDYLVKGDVKSSRLLAAISYAMERQRIRAEIQQKSEELAVSEARLRMVVELNADGILIVDTRQKISLANRAAAQMFGCEEAKLLGEQFEYPIAPHKKVEIDIHSATGQSIIAEMCSVEMEWQNQPAFLISLRDITERKEYESRLQYLATHDTLTGLPNRQLFQDRLEQAIKRANRKQAGKDTRSLVAVMLMDLDNFKAVNDTYGHGTGDQLLIWVADQLRSRIRQSDTIARLGGDEFTLVLEGITGVEDARLIAEKIGDALKSPYQLEDKEINITASIGICLFPQDGEDAETLLMHADIAMYQAKRSRQQTVFYRPAAVKIL